MKTNQNFIKNFNRIFINFIYRRTFEMEFKLSYIA